MCNRASFTIYKDARLHMHTESFHSASKASTVPRPLQKTDSTQMSIMTFFLEMFVAFQNILRTFAPHSFGNDIIFAQLFRRTGTSKEIYEQT